MKHNFHAVALIFLLVFLITTSHSSARKLATKQGEVDEKFNNNISKESVVKNESTDSFDNLMGLEKCQNEDEECLNRRVILEEADLDYIYSRQNKP